LHSVIVVEGQYFYIWLLLFRLKVNQVMSKEPFYGE